MNTLRELSDNANQDYYDNLQKKGYNSYYNSLEDMMFNVADKDKEGAKKVATHILKTVKAPKNKDGTEAYLNLLKNAAIQNPDCAELALNKINQTFSQFSSSEKIQKKALSVINELSSYSIFRDDEFVSKKMSGLNKKFQNRIDAQDLLHKRGQKNEWEDDEFNFNQQMEFSKSKKREIDPKIVEKYKGDYGFEL
ncbi:MAG: hypothetical protein J6X42_06305 [Alphaproteobacteria bacterium]|nr:hypothetical protein [Alphaproteobacteria bacterium]